jgi:hypothetical protein
VAKAAPESWAVQAAEKLAKVAASCMLEDGERGWRTAGRLLSPGGRCQGQRCLVKVSTGSVIAWGLFEAGFRGQYAFWVDFEAGGSAHKARCLRRVEVEESST